MIYKIIEQLKIAEYDHHQAKEKLQRKEDSLHLHTDWTKLKEEGITNQRQREARIREITREEREQAFKTQLEQDHIRRVYHAMLHEQPPTGYIRFNRKTGEKKGVEMDGI